jgi:putative phage-type endonuclease
MKRARLDPDVIDKLTSEAWKSVLQSEHEKKITITDGKTIRINNIQEHLKYSASQLEWKRSEQSDSDSESSQPSTENIESTHFESREDRIQMKPSEFYSTYVDRTIAQCQEELKAPQRSQEWLDARRFCITASQFGSAAGVSPYQSRETLLVDKLWNTFKGNAATDWGTFHECHAKETFCAWLKDFMGEKHFVFREENLMKFSAEPWMAVSPDGLVEYEDGIDLVEFKCPAFLRNTADHPYSKWPNNVPPQYLAQIQGIMGYLNTNLKESSQRIKRCWFVVWQPHQTWITLISYDQEYYSSMHATIKDWYFKELLPAFTHQANGVLNFGDTKPSEPIVVES